MTNRIHTKRLFSVVTINYNNSSGLERTIKSVINQTVRDQIQYIVVDGDSNDKSQEVISKYKNKIDNIIVEKDEGVYDAMNKGLELSDGKWTIFMNSGDIFAEDDVVSEMRKRSKDNPECIAIYGDTLLHNSKLWPTKPLEELWKGMICSHQSIAINTEHLKTIKFDTNLKIAADYKTILSAYFTGLEFLKVDNKPISRIEPVGISSAFQERTLERWLINKQFKNSKISKVLMNRFYSQLLSNGEGEKPPSTDELDLDLSYVEKNIIFLISMPRSGSTLLQRIIETSPYIESTGEPWVALPVISMYDQKLIDSMYDQQVLNSARNSLKSELKISDTHYENAERSYLYSLYSSISNIIESPYYLDKTPRYSLIIERLYELLPNARYIILRRNPLSVINSYCSTWSKNDLKRVANNKHFMNDFENGFVNIVDFANKHKSSHNVLDIDFEQLTADPSEIEKLLTNFLGTPVKTKDFNQDKFKKRVLGDPKTINNSNSVLNKNTDPTVDACKFINREYYRNILNIIPSKVFDFYKINVNDFLTSVESKDLTSQITKEKLSKNDSLIRGISTIITSYNNSSTILEAIASALNQTRPPEEIIVIDDCSSDNSVDKILDFISTNQSKSTNIRLIKNSKNKGVSCSRDIAIREAKCRYITTLDGDDTISPLKFKYEFQALEQNNAKIAFSDIKLLTNGGAKILNTRFYDKKDQTTLLTALSTRSHPVPRDMMFDKDLYISVGGFMKGFDLYEDWMLKQKLTVADGTSGWVHSGVIGTCYNRTNPGLSNKSNVKLFYAQLKVLAINSDLIAKNGLSWYLIFSKMKSLYLNTGLDEFEKVVLLLKNSDDLNITTFVQLKLKEMRQKLNQLPANKADDKVIIDALNFHWAIK